MTPPPAWPILFVKSLGLFSYWIWFLDTQNRFYFIVKRLKMHFWLPSSDSLFREAGKSCWSGALFSVDLKLWVETKPNNNKTDQESSSVRWLDLSPMQTSSYRWSYSPPTLKTDQVSVGNFSDFHKTLFQPNFSNGPIMALQFFSQWHHNLNNSENKHQINKQGGCCWRSWFLTPSRI